jgi:hypothetical protein
MFHEVSRQHRDEKHDLQDGHELREASNSGK